MNLMINFNLIKIIFTSTTERNTHSAITKLSDNSLVLVYTKHEYDGINWNYSLYSQKLDFNGNILGNEFQIKSSSFFHISFIRDLGDDGYIVIWSNFYQEIASTLDKGSIQILIRLDLKLY